MPPSPDAAWSPALGEAVRSVDAAGALRSGLAAADAGVPPLEIVRAAALAYAGSVDVSPEFPPHGMLALSAAARLTRHLPPRLQALPVLQALTLAAADAKLPYDPLRKRTKVAGEISHLTRSFEVAVRAGAFDDAVAIFSGLLREGRERVMAGDVLFRVAAEDMALGGHKMITAVQGWRLASALGWRSGDVLMGPVVARVATGVREPAPYRAILSAWGREKLDIAAVGGNEGPADGGERDAIRSALRASSLEDAARGVVRALKRGVGLDGIASVAVEEAAARLAAAKEYDFPAIHGLIFAGLARWVLRFSRTETRVLPLLQACLALQGLPHGTAAPALLPAKGVADLVRDAARAMEAGDAAKAGDCVHTYLSRGFPPAVLIELLVRQACRDGPAANAGHNLILADAAVEEATPHTPPATGPLVALARMLALSPRERSAWETLGKRFPLGSTSS
ncbi:MAG: hypothetical protein A3K65_01670 [Euryarchaeota archaeon RBG_16_68_12]|nr:MAG: hypothetical protein A3K65_01670 [Euryarchaeota archaeon RBG_16_68_12]